MKTGYLITTTALALSLSATNFASSCEPGRVELQVLGSGGPELSDQRAGSSYLVRVDGKARLLVDMGPGSSLNLERSGARIAELDAVLFSHLHVDHSADFPSLIKASFFAGRQHDLRVLGPDSNHLMPSTEQFVSRLVGKEGAFAYLSSYYEPDQRSRWKIKPQSVAGGPLDVSNFKLSDDLSVNAIPIHHGPIAAVAWRVQAAGCSITFSGDMSNRYESLSRLAQNTDLLVAHNAIPEQARGVARNLHMPPSEIGKIANESGSHALLLSHRMERTLEREPETSSHIRQYYSGPLHFANDLDRIALPARFNTQPAQ